ncbi:haloacid dehalogenase [Longimonas halophila]|uniref:Haloacid dehalogenase n=1 Tax=Longimonas halophila TaxID=1469170 RepID=A0A2H3NPY0_9BACT|nr:HAD-IA family hydrolase [Longimonas halophila]PEN07643.1 haloacid dehalogenase [Longimonas halophila]
MPPIRFVYFDLDDTLLDHRHAERAALGDVIDDFPVLFTGHDLDAVHDTYHRINKPLWQAYAQGDIDKVTVKEQRFHRLLDALGAGTEQASVVHTRYLQRYGAHWQYMPGAQQAFAQIANQYGVGILTNGFSETQQRKMNQFPALRRASASVIICEEVGHLKPHPAVFAHATEQARVAPGEILYVGDSYTSDVKGSARAGWQMAWYTPHTAPHTSVAHGFTFSDWSDLLRRVL